MYCKYTGFLQGGNYAYYAVVNHLFYGAAAGETEVSGGADISGEAEISGEEEGTAVGRA